MDSMFNTSSGQSDVVRRLRPSQTWGWYGSGRTGRLGDGMKWRVMVELIGGDGIVQMHEISTGGSNTAECSAARSG